jgi:hypothetical protein
MLAVKTLLRKHLSVAPRRPSPQSIGLAGHVNDTVVHLDDDWRDWCMFCHLYLVDSTAAAGPVVPELVLLLPICSAASFDKVIIVQPFGSFRCKM